MRFEKLQWLFPIAVAIHNAEEAIWMPGWWASLAGQLPLHPPSATEFRSVLFMLTAAAVVVTSLSERNGPGSLWSYLLFGSIIAVLANVFIPHVPATLVFHSYAPGVVTAVVINLPVMSFLALQAVRERWVSGAKALAFGVGVPVALGVAIVGLFASDKIVR